MLCLLQKQPILIDGVDVFQNGIVARGKCKWSGEKKKASRWELEDDGYLRHVGRIDRESDVIWLPGVRMRFGSLLSE